VSWTESVAASRWVILSGPAWARTHREPERGR